MQQSIFTQEAFSDLLPYFKGRINFDVLLHTRTWFKVGGCAETLINPADDEDLAYILKTIPLEWPIFTLGATSNLLIRDGGIRGINFQLRRGFNQIIPDNDNAFIVGAACLDSTVAEHAAAAGVGGLEFLVGIPGSIGGAVKMNAGAHGSEMSAILDWVEIITREGKLMKLSVNELNLTYRHSSLPPDAIVTKARLYGHPADKAHIGQAMANIKAQREQSQPIHSRTGGSTFRNPLPGVSTYKAWQLVDMVGGRGLMIGGAQVSEKHCNFLINTGNASAADIENLGEEVRKRVLDQFGVQLIWEIKRIGYPLQNEKSE